jgi:three-Cys-motif partner protein
MHGSVEGVLGDWHSYSDCAARQEQITHFSVDEGKLHRRYFTCMSPTRYHIDPEDGLVAGECRGWATLKHDTLARYIQITLGVRRKFVDRVGAAYIDLYAGAGRALNTDSGEFQDGSPLVAWKQALASNVPFSKVLINDIDPALLQACKVRLERLGASVHSMGKDMVHAAAEVARSLNPEGYHLAFLDPYDLGIPFAAIKSLGSLRRIDMLLHVSAMELQRNLPKAATDAGVRRKLDAFAPGWDEVVQPAANTQRQREQFVAHWVGLLESLGAKTDTRWRLITNRKSAPLYWLVLIARHKLAHEFWRKQGSITPQGDLF